ncbi:MAG: hypothetical protein IJS81_05235 [Selenomonadaceae bacterium]|nr:hypothetical protein [Selenomonadaceae bacterium]
MLKKFALFAALTIIFSASQCFAKTAAPVFDKDEKFFVAAFNFVAQKVTESNNDGIKFFGLDTQIYFQEKREGEDYYTARSMPNDIGTVAILVKRTPENLYKISFASKTEEDVSKALAIALIVIGFNEQEMKSVTLQTAEETVWCEKIQRDVMISNGTSDDAFVVSLQAFTRD